MPPPLSVVHVVNSLRMGGLENGLVNLINRTPENQYKHSIVCLTDYDDFCKRIKREDAAIYALHKKPGKDISWYFRLHKILKTLKPDIVHTRNLATIESHIVALLSGVRGRVHSEHGWDMQDLNGANRKYRLLRRLVSPLIARFIPLSKELENYLVDTISVPKRKVSRICNGVDSERFMPGIKRGILPFIEAPDETVVVGCIGRMQTVKDPMNLVNAFTTIIRDYPDTRQKIRLVMIGDGPVLKEAQEMLRSLNLGDIVWLPGHRDDIPELLQQFDIFVLPSKAEGISNTILEAMSSGLPIVATRVGGNYELIEEGENGVLVPASDSDALAAAIFQYTKDDELCARHGARSRKIVEESFSITGMIAKYMEIYDGVAVR